MFALSRIPQEEAAPEAEEAAPEAEVSAAQEASFVGHGGFQKWIDRFNGNHQ